jgi:hypothetical protein
MISPFTSWAKGTDALHAQFDASASRYAFFLFSIAVSWRVYHTDPAHPGAAASDFEALPPIILPFTHCARRVG